jgi:hypothetical protein
MGNGCSNQTISQPISKPINFIQNTSSQFQVPPTYSASESSNNQSESSEEQPQKYIGAIRNVASTGGFIFEVKRYDSIKDPFNEHASLKHSTSPSLNTIDKQSTNLTNMMRMATLGPSPEQIQAQKDRMKELEEDTESPNEIILPPEKQQLLEIPNNGLELMKMKTPNWGEIDKEASNKKSQFIKNNAIQKNASNSQPPVNSALLNKKEEIEEKPIESSASIMKCLRKPKIKATSSKKHFLKPILQGKNIPITKAGNEKDELFQNQDLLNISKIDEIPSMASSVSVLFALEKKFTTSNNNPDFDCSAIDKQEVMN